MPEPAASVGAVRWRSRGSSDDPIFYSHTHYFDVFIILRFSDSAGIDVTMLRWNGTGNMEHEPSG